MIHLKQYEHVKDFSSSVGKLSTLYFSNERNGEAFGAVFYDKDKLFCFDFKTGTTIKSPAALVTNLLQKETNLWEILETFDTNLETEIEEQDCCIIYLVDSALAEKF